MADGFSKQIDKAVCDAAVALNNAIDIIAKESGVPRGGIMLSVAFFNVKEPCITYNAVGVLDKTQVYVDGMPVRRQIFVEFKLAKEAVH